MTELRVAVPPTYRDSPDDRAHLAWQVGRTHADVDLQVVDVRAGAVTVVVMDDSGTGPRTMGVPVSDAAWGSRDGAAQVEALLRQRNLTLASWNPASREATAMRAGTYDDDLRGLAAAHYGVSREPWRLRLRSRFVPGRLDAVTVVRDSSLAAHQGGYSLLSALPEYQGQWLFAEDTYRREVVLTWGPTPRLPDLVPFDEPVEDAVSTTTPWRVGVDDQGRDVLVDIARGGHILIAGATRSGKSVSTYGLITHLLRMRGAVRLLIADPNDTTIAPFEGMVAWSTSSVSPEPLTEMLQWARDEGDRRKLILRGMRADAIREFSEDLPLIVIIIDEAANYLRSGDKSASDAFRTELLACVSQLAKYGIRIVLITQRPSGDILDTSTRAQLATRISFRLEDKQTAAMAFPELGESTELLGLKPGEGFIREVGDELRRFRGVYVDDHWGIAARIGYRQPRISVNGRPEVELATMEMNGRPVVELATMEMTMEDLLALEDDGQMPPEPLDEGFAPPTVAEATAGDELDWSLADL